MFNIRYNGNARELVHVSERNGEVVIDAVPQVRYITDEYDLLDFSSGVGPYGEVTPVSAFSAGQNVSMSSIQLDQAAEDLL